MTDKFHIVLSTYPDTQTAEIAAKSLVAGRLAGCVNIIPGLRSYYEWKGNIESSNECLLIIKSRVDLFDRLRVAITAEHPYELPELIAVPIRAGSPAYVEWLDATMRINE